MKYGYCSICGVDIRPCGGGQCEPCRALLQQIAAVHGHQASVTIRGRRDSARVARIEAYRQQALAQLPLFPPRGRRPRGEQQKHVEE